MESNSPSEPHDFACALPPPELRRRRVEVLAGVRRAVSRIEETSDGFVFTFARSPELLLELEEFIRFEASCCSFINIELVSLGDEAQLRVISSGRESRRTRRSRDGSSSPRRSD